MKKSSLITATVLTGIIVLGVLFAYRVPIRDAVSSFFAPTLPEPTPVTAFPTQPDNSGTTTATTTPMPSQKPELQKTLNGTQNGTTTKSLPAGMNLSIPFVSQAPFSDWNLPYQEACEEASVIMVHYYLQNKELTPEIMDREILKLVEWENEKFGDYKHTSVAQTVQILNEYLGYTNIKVLTDFSLDDLKAEIAKGHPVIVPAAGRQLGNPYFQNPGPIYHMLVMKGYTKDNIITNDPGTRRGRDFTYRPDVFLAAIHDWHAEDISKGAKSVIVVKK